MVQLFNEGGESADSGQLATPLEGPGPTAVTDSVSAAAEGTRAEPRFEDAYQRLEVLVAEMERGDLPLEQLLARFEEGVGLVRHCRSFLKQAQLRVEQYVEQRDGHWVLKELE